MNVYSAWFDLAEGESDLAFVAALEAYLGDLKARGLLHGWRLLRRKLGLAPPGMPEFHLMMEFEGLAQLDSAFGTVAKRSDPIEGLHHAVNSRVKGISFALYRDFPDPVRQQGEERF